jgi:hypothetical protein
VEPRRTEDRDVQRKKRELRKLQTERQNKRGRRILSMDEEEKEVNEEDEQGILLIQFH